MTARPTLDLMLRPALVADLSDILALERRCYSDPWPASSFAALPANPQVCFAVARHALDGSLAGFAVAWYVLDEGELANLSVSPEVRRRGLGRQLLGFVMDDARNRGIGMFFLEVRESNIAARALYLAESFVEVGRRKQYYRKPTEDALILRRDLSSSPSS